MYLKGDGPDGQLMTSSANGSSATGASVNIQPASGAVKMSDSEEKWENVGFHNENTL